MCPRWAHGFIFLVLARITTFWKEIQHLIFPNMMNFLKIPSFSKIHVSPRINPATANSNTTFQPSAPGWPKIWGPQNERCPISIKYLFDMSATCYSRRHRRLLHELFHQCWEPFVLTQQSAWTQEASSLPSIWLELSQVDYLYVASGWQRQRWQRIGCFSRSSSFYVSFTRQSCRN